jgi:DNA-binding LacI/PurR family transcriptional regulator
MNQKPVKGKQKASRRREGVVTMGDLAKETGLSKMTISRVFADSSNVRQSTREKVLRASQKLGYEYNALAGNFASGRSGLIGVAIDVGALMGSVYFARLFKGAHGLLEDAGYRSVMFDTASEEFSDGARLARLVAQRRVDGLLAIVPPRNRTAFLSSFSRQHTSIVVIGGRCDEASIPWVDLDNHHAVELLLRHLHRLGHRKIGFLAGPGEITDAIERADAFHALRETLQLEWDEKWQQDGEFGYGTGREGAHRILAADNRPTAILAANDASALGACEAIRALGMTPGREISVAGIDGWDLAEQADPPITTISQPLEQIGERAANMLLEGIPEKKDAKTPANAVLQGSLLTRASTGPAPDS